MIIHERKPRGTSKRRGTVIFMALVVVLLLTTFSAASVGLVNSFTSETEFERQHASVLYLAEAGANRAVTALRKSLDDGTVPPPTVGTVDDPHELSGGTYWATITDNGDDTYTVVATASANRSERAVEVVLVRAGASPFDHALFAGNTSEDAGYSLSLGGDGRQADMVNGNVYSGGSVSITGDAVVDGDINAAGGIVGGEGETGVVWPAPDIPGMDYEVNHDFNVRELFYDSGLATWRSDDAGGSAWQLPESSPGHIFRLNPSDRRSETSSTEKDDYFLEDPYERLRSDSGSDGSDPYRITLSGTAGDPGPDGNGKVYFIDGNLWIHNYNTFSFQLYNGGSDGGRVTFIVKGSIFFSDNVFYEDVEKDGIAFVAITDEDVEDSGNIYFGDPEYGTLEEMHAFMYAENNFYDYNLDAAGSAEVRVFGNMSAGNHVSIERDYVARDGSTQHSKLTVDFDDRLSTDQLYLPGLPGTPSGSDWRISSWREVPVL